MFSVKSYIIKFRRSIKNYLYVCDSFNNILDLKLLENTQDIDCCDIIFACILHYMYGCHS